VANSTLDDAKLILRDLWPGEPDFKLSKPPDGFTGASHHNVASPVYPVGIKIKVYDETNKGYATFIYLQYVAGTKAATLALAVKQFVSMDTSEQATAATSPTYFKVTDDASEALIHGPIAVALGAMTTAYYGWFWCGGVCPVSFVSGLGGNYVTDGTLAAGKGITAVANASLTSTQGDKIILSLAMTNAAHATSVVDYPILGTALIDDA